MRRAALTLTLLAALACASLAWALSRGSAGIGLGALLDGLRGIDSPALAVILELRLPRALAAFATGGMLALSGALMQVLLRNPLADPYVLGVSGGAAVGALGLMLAGASGWWIDAGAAGGALASMALVFGIAHGRGAWTPLRLLLTGVIVAAGWGALIGLLLSLAPDPGLRGMVFWLMGDLSTPPAPLAGLAVLAAGLLLALPLARALNVLAHGELTAASLGVAVRPLRYALYGLASLLAAGAVTLAGSVGFVGLVTPHLLRLAIGADHRLLLPAAALAGGSLLVIADTLARTVIAPQQLPVGTVTALIGVPLFLWLLHGRRGD